MVTDISKAKSAGKFASHNLPQDGMDILTLLRALANRVKLRNMLAQSSMTPLRRTCVVKELMTMMKFPFHFVP